MDEDQIQREIERLRKGGVLNPDGAKALALGISRKFDELAEGWGKRFSIGAWTDLHTSAPTQLHFCQRTEPVGQGRIFQRRFWTFVILYTHERDELRISEANFEQRSAAARALPQLEKALAENNAANKSELLSAFDTISKYAEEAIDD